MRAPRSLLPWAACLLPSAGCFVDVDAIPPDTVIDCTAADDCPRDWVCREELGRCVLRSELDDEPPRLVEASLSPAVVGRGGTAVLTLKTNEPLLEPPVVGAFFGAGSLAFDVVPAQDDPRAFVATYTVDDDDVEGHHRVLVDLVDRGGSANRGLDVGVLTLDFTAPVVDVAATQVDPPVARPGTVVAVRVVLDEATDGALALTASGPVAITAERTQAGGGLATFRLALAADAPDGDYDLVLSSAADLAGNAAPDVVVGRLAVDGTPPALSGLALSRARASAVPGFDEVVLTFLVDDPAASVEASVAGVAATCADGACRRVLDGSEAEGGALATLTARDLVGNQATASLPLVVDFSPPAIVAGSEVVSLSPPPGALLDEVDAAAAGTRVRVGFALDEPAGALPTVRVVEDGSVLQPVSQAGAQVHELTVGDEPSGPRTLVVEVVDEVGNAAARPLSVGFEIDQDAPAPLDDDALSRFVLVRAPWGADETDGQKRFSIRGAGAPSDVVVVAWDDADLAIAGEIGRGVPGPDGAVSFDLQRTDRSVVHLGLVDRAGNASAPRRVRRTEWIATFGFKVPGSRQENPHDLVRAGQLGVARDHVVAPGSGNVFEGGATLALVDGAATSTRGTASYRKIGPSEQPSPRNNDFLVEDPARGRLELVSPNARDHWRRKGAVWSSTELPDPEGDGNPLLDRIGGIVYDSLRDRVVLLRIPSGAPVEVWESDGTSWRRPPQEVAPTERVLPTFAYDEGLGASVLFGGDSTRDTWLWDGERWSEIATATAPPLPVQLSEPGVMTYDAQSEECVLFVNGETWVFRDLDWQEVTPPTSPPSRSRHGFAFDETRGRAVLTFGLTPGGSSIVTDVWEWDGAARAWLRIVPQDPEGDGNPAPRTTAALAYAAGEQASVLFGGFASGARLNDLWAWNGASWRRLPTSSHTPASGVPTLAAREPLRDVLVAADFAELPAVSEYQDGAWTRRTPVDTGDGEPSDDSDFRMGADASGRVVLVGREPREMWRWNGAEWRRVNDGAGPVLGGFHLVAVDPAAGHLYTFGGSTGAARHGELWRWDGASWTKLDDGAAGPGFRYYGAMAWDEARERLVLFSGRNEDFLLVEADTWEWSPDAGWLKVPTTDVEGDGEPEPLASHAMTFDPLRGRVVVHGGSYETETLLGARAALWSFTGGSWELVETADPEGDGGMGEVQHHAMLADPATGELVLFGARSIEVLDVPHSYAVTSPATARPADLVRFDLRAAGLPLATLQELELRVVAAGEGPDGAGTELLGWRRGRWTSIDVAAGPGLAARAIVFEDPRALASDGAAHFAIAPVSRNGAARATVGTDYVELRARFVEP